MRLLSPCSDRAQIVLWSVFAITLSAEKLRNIPFTREMAPGKRQINTESGRPMTVCDHKYTP